MLRSATLFAGERLSSCSRRMADRPRPVCLLVVTFVVWAPIAGASADETHRGVYVDVRSGLEKPLRWRASIGSQSGQPVVAGHTILIGTNNSRPRDPERTNDAGIIMGFSTDGVFLWQARHDKLPHRANDLPLLGIQSRPAVDGDRAYYVSNRGELVCLDLSGFRDGENDGPDHSESIVGPYAADFVWRLDMVRELGVYKRDASDIGNPVCSPLVSGGLVYCLTGNGSLFGVKVDVPLVPNPDAPSFIAVDKLTGEVVWSKSLPGRKILYGQWGSPIVVTHSGLNSVLFPGGDGTLYAFQPATGELLWRLDCNQPDATDWSDRHQGTKRFFVAAPAADGDTVYAALNEDLEPVRSGVPHPLLAIDIGGTADTNVPRIKWRFDDAEFGGVYGRVVVSETVLYAVFDSGILYAFDSQTGKVHWTADLGERACLFGSPLVYDHTVYVATQSELVLFQAGRAKKELERYDLGGVIRSTPVVFGDTMLVATNESLCALPLDSR